MKIYIFASKDINKTSANKIKNLRINPNDKVILCNNPDDPCISELLLKKNRHVDFRFLRGHPQQLFPDYTVRLKKKFNHRNTEYYVSEATDIELFKHVNRLRFNKVHNLKIKYEDRLTDKQRYTVLNVDYNGNKRPSLGFMAAVMMRKRYPNAEIYLCGFTFLMGSIHDSEFEKDYLLNKSKNFYII